jgi:hypothetical protein
VLGDDPGRRTGLRQRERWKQQGKNRQQPHEV